MFWVILYFVVDVHLDGLPIFLGVITQRRKCKKVVTIYKRWDLCLTCCGLGVRREGYLTTYERGDCFAGMQFSISAIMWCLMKQIE
jgi:hypothetical protein